MPTNEFKKENTLLPIDTKNRIANLELIQNFSLKLNKCVNWVKKDTFDSAVPEIAQMSSLSEVQIDALKFKKDRDKDKEFCIKADFSAVSISEIRSSYQESIEALCSGFRKVSDLKPNWRLVIGLGNESVYETSMTLHHVYGIPYIPASGIKGLLHHWATDTQQDKEIIELIFGTEEKIGNVLFFDSFPIKLSNDSIQPDIINPHYPDYYDGKKPPADWQSPRPIFFLTVKDTQFEFFFGVKKGADEYLLDTLTNSETGWLYLALKEYGIGAKTAVGYGRMLAPEIIKAVFYNRRLRKGDKIEGQIIAQGKVKNVELFISENDRPTVSIRYGTGFTEENIGKIIQVEIKSLKGGAKPQLDENGLCFVKFKDQ